MSKEFKIFLTFIGVVFIAFGVLLMISKAAIESGVFLKEEETTNIGIDTTNIIGDKIDTSAYKDYRFDNFSNNIAIKSSDIENTTKYKILYPSDMKIKRDNFNDIFIYNEKSSISGFFVDKSIEEYKKYLQETYKLFTFDKMNISFSKGPEKINKSEIEYMKISIYSKEDIDSYGEYFYIMIKETENKTAVIFLSVQDRKLTDSFLSSFVNAIEIETNE